MIHRPNGQPILSAAGMRAVEEAVFARGVSQDELMERAGLAVARWTARLAAGCSVLVLAGPANNGGDAYVAARHLRSLGYDVTIAALGAPKAGAAARMAALWGGLVVPLAEMTIPMGDYVIVDGLFGIGAQGQIELDADPRALIDHAGHCIAIDLPSGIDSDTGQAVGIPITATVTVALGALKPAHLFSNACGRVVFDDLGITDDINAHLSTDSGSARMVERPAPRVPQASDHKYRSVVAVISGGMPGAARLAAKGAIGAGAGYVMLVGDPACVGPLDAIVHRPLDALGKVLTDDRCTLVLGPGLGRDQRARSILEGAVGSQRTLILDGDALTLLGKDTAERLCNRGASTILTPHEGEFARMFGEGTGNKLERTAAAAKAASCTIVHKGHVTVCADQTGAVRVSTGGSPWLATAGTGDVLAGAFAASPCSPDLGIWLHARASQLAGVAFSADRLADTIPLAVAELA